MKDLWVKGRPSCYHLLNQGQRPLQAFYQSGEQSQKQKNKKLTKLNVHNIQFMYIYRGNVKSFMKNKPQRTQSAQSKAKKSKEKDKAVKKESISLAV
jgi:hypothetical protein